MGDTCLMIKYKESKLPEAKYIAASWMQLRVYAHPDMIVAVGDAVIIDYMVTEVREYAQRRKQDIITFCYSYIDPLTIKYYAPTIEVKETKEP